jgi:hypothetical protein
LNRDEHVIFCSGYNVHTLFWNLQKRSLKWTLQTLKPSKGHLLVAVNCRYPGWSTSSWI